MSDVCTHVILVSDAKFARHPQHPVPQDRVYGQGLAQPSARGRPAAIIKEQILDVGRAASLKQSNCLFWGKNSNRHHIFCINARVCTRIK